MPRSTGPRGLDEQLDYALLHKMAVLYEKNGTINIRISLKNLVRQ